jgi:2-polyprenyl-6-methoxyphenol hydroxylase-like FAD-dependent oxidoreductase
VGDAAYGPTPLTGQGTSLAILGAFVLAGELSKHDSYRDAFGSYETLLRSHVEQCQWLAPGLPRLAHPKSKLGVWVLNKAAGVISWTSSFFPNRVSRLDSFQLPKYPPFNTH